MSRWQRISQFTESASWCLQQLRGPKSSTTKLPIELLQDVDGMGAAGTIAKVNHGYARNYLVPNKLAAVRRGKQAGSVAEIQEQSNTSSSSAAMAVAGSATAPSGALNEEEREKLLVAQQRRRLESAVKKLTTQTLTMRRKVTEDGKLDKAVVAEDIADAVARQLQIEIVSELIDMGGEQLKSVGEYEVPLKLMLPGGERAKLDANIVST
ncbi:hypothetical protein Ndes2526A_g01931 [Nannochloris sp. 'desiccata']